LAENYTNKQRFFVHLKINQKNNNPMKVHVIESGKFKLDGGAMFGVVPKVMWNKLNPADDNNMCTWSMRCLLIEQGNRKILIDTGMGDKQDEKFRSHFHPHGEHNLILSLKMKGVEPEEITDVFLTHLHFDHVGGALKFDANGKIVPTFPNANYWSNEVHYNWAYKNNDREKASFIKDNFVPLKEQGQLKFIDVEQDVKWMDNINIRYSYGHTEAMMSPFITLPNGKLLVYAADLMPSSYHIRMPYVMSYDIRPMKTLEDREMLYSDLLAQEHILFFEHDPVHEAGTIYQNDRGRVGLKDSFDLKDQL